MGYYIETPLDKNKAHQLIEFLGAQKESGPIKPTKERIGICVVENGPFDAAAIIFSENEGKVFAWEGDYRIKHWLSLPYDVVIKHCPSVKRALEL